MMISENWGEFLLPILRNVFDKHIGQMKDFIPVLYNVETSKKAQEFTHGIGSIGLMKEWTETGGQVNYDIVNPGFKATYTHKKYSNGLRVERELLEDAQYPEVKKKTKALADSLYKTRQWHASYPFNNATTFLGPDGKALCATDHPIAPGSSSTWSNYATGRDLTADNLEWARNQMKEWKDDNGDLFLVNPDTMLVPKALRKGAMIVADTDNEPWTSDHAVNIWKGSVDVIECDFLTDSTMWFLIDKNRMNNFLTWYQRRAGKIEQDKEDFDSEVAKYKIVERFSYGFDEPSFIYGLKTS